AIDQHNPKTRGEIEVSRVRRYAPSRRPVAVRRVPARGDVAVAVEAHYLVALGVGCIYRVEVVVRVHRQPAEIEPAIEWQRLRRTDVPAASAAGCGHCRR